MDRKKIRTLRRIFYSVIVESKWGLGGTETVFDFKYVPEFSTMTEMGQSEAVTLKHLGAERRALKTLIIAGSVLAVGSWCALKIASAIVGYIWS